VAVPMLALILSVLPMTQARAQVVCPPPPTSTLDSDGDGFSDAEEFCGITLLDGALVSMNPNTKDLFIIVLPATPSRLPADPAEFISKPQAQGGLGIITHLIGPSQVPGPDRLVGLTQKAVSVTESSDTNGQVAGECPWGTANDPLALCVVYTKKIEDFVTSVYASVGQAAPADVIVKYKKHTFAHEASHSMRVTKQTYDRCTGGTHHYKSGTNTIMDCQVIYTVKGGVITWTIGNAYTGTDAADTTLTGP